jgi:uncharacterized protein YbjT (DUF2867 family)
MNNTSTAPHPLRHPSVLLLGATGFIGSYVLRELLAQGMQVLAVRRQASVVLAGSPGLRWIDLPLQRMLSATDWQPHLSEVDVVINCVGILRQRLGESYEAIHHQMPAALAKACAQSGVRLIHTSALGLHEGAKSRFLSSKLRGEQAIAASGCDHCVVRPSLIDGLGGFGASWLRMLASWPVHFVPVGATGQIAAVQAHDLGIAFAALASKPSLADWRQANLFHFYFINEVTREAMIQSQDTIERSLSGSSSIVLNPKAN